jgi:hypothetical protein
MVKNYASPFFLLFSGMAFLAFPHYGHGQEIKLFSVSDFDLIGPVKSCTVITDYGKEEFAFNEDGALAQSITRYNDTDYEITIYKYSNGELAEKRLENYREGEFDKNTSMANFYSVDTTENKKITEKIISYNKELLYQYEYYYDGEDRLSRIKRITNDAIDNTLLEYETYKGEQTVSHFQNGELIKSVRTSKTKLGGNEEMTNVLTKEFVNGKPTAAVEKTFNGKDFLVAETLFTYDESTKKFVSGTTKKYLYNKAGALVEQCIKMGKTETVKKYIYQYDDAENGNWIKQIVTPDNAYTTRKIVYYTDGTP